MRTLAWNWPIRSSRGLGLRLWGQNPQPLELTQLTWTVSGLHWLLKSWFLAYQWEETVI